MNGMHEKWTLYSWRYCNEMRGGEGKGGKELKFEVKTGFFDIWRYSIPM